MPEMTHGTVIHRPLRLAIVVGGFILRATGSAGFAHRRPCGVCLSLRQRTPAPPRSTPHVRGEGPPSRQPRQARTTGAAFYAHHIPGILRRVVAPDVGRSRAREARSPAGERQSCRDRQVGLGALLDAARIEGRTAALRLQT
jgi:hypothetical protein